MPQATLAVIVGNRDFFPDRLIGEGRQDILNLFKEMDIEPIMVGENDTKLGAVETWAHAKRCAELFASHRKKIDGILITLPNFGDEKGVADTIKLSGLDVPILVQAYPDDLNKLNLERRRDAFCGKISVCNNLKQYGFPFSLTSLHTDYPHSDTFKSDLDQFIRVCKVVKGMRSARLGAVGARPNAFNTVRYSEKILQESGITVATIDLSEIIGKAQQLPDDNAKVKAKLDEINAYADASKVPPAPMTLMAKFAVTLEEWMEENDLNATAIQCWTSIQQNYGINACTIMSMMSEKLIPSACEVDVTGVATMYALQLASGTPSALVDWNNNYADDPDKCILFHCGNWARCFLPGAKIVNAHILANILGEGVTYGALDGRTPGGQMTYARISTDDAYGAIRAYVGEGNFTDDPLDTFGSRAVLEIPGMQSLMRFICENGFEHHVAVNRSQCADALEEAFGKYLFWDVYHHIG